MGTLQPPPSPWQHAGLAKREPSRSAQKKPPPMSSRPQIALTATISPPGVVWNVDAELGAAREVQVQCRCGAAVLRAQALLRVACGPCMLVLLAPSERSPCECLASDAGLLLVDATRVPPSRMWMEAHQAARHAARLLRPLLRAGDSVWWTVGATRQDKTWPSAAASLVARLVAAALLDPIAATLAACRGRHALLLAMGPGLAPEEEEAAMHLVRAAPRLDSMALLPAGQPDAAGGAALLDLVEALFAAPRWRDPAWAPPVVQVGPCLMAQPGATDRLSALLAASRFCVAGVLADLPALAALGARLERLVLQLGPAEALRLSLDTDAPPEAQAAQRFFRGAPGRHVLVLDAGTPETLLRLLSRLCSWRPAHIEAAVHLWGGQAPRLRGQIRALLQVWHRAGEPLDPASCLVDLQAPAPGANPGKTRLSLHLAWLALPDPDPATAARPALSVSPPLPQ